MERRSSGIWPGGMAVTLRPPTRICPPLGSSSRKTSFRNVVLPAPEGPVRKQNSPRSTCSVMSERALESRSYCLWTWKACIMRVRDDASGIVARRATNDMTRRMPNVPTALRRFHPWPLTRGGHRQTLIGRLVRSRLAWRLPSEDVVLPAPDGARLLLRATWQPGPREASPTLLLVHGLGGD